jgi:Fe-S-cluster containining protein
MLYLNVCNKKETVINPCSGCNAPCCKNYIVTVTSFDVVKIAEKTKKKIEAFAELYPARLLTYDWDTVIHCFDNEYPDYYLLALKSHPCIFHDKGNRCQIHDFAPFICRRYPYDLAGKEFMRRHCSVVSNFLFQLRGPTTQEEIWKIEAYRKIVKEWNQKKGRKKDCMGFLMKRASEETVPSPRSF